MVNRYSQTLFVAVCSARHVQVSRQLSYREYFLLRGPGTRIIL